jgi:hypothetical protein
MRENRTSGLTSGVWKQGMEKASEAPATKRAGKQMGFSYTTAPHPDSTRLGNHWIDASLHSIFGTGTAALTTHCIFDWTVLHVLKIEPV